MRTTLAPLQERWSRTRVAQAPAPPGPRPRTRPVLRPGHDPFATSSNSARARPARPKASASNRTDIGRGRRSCLSSKYLIARVLSPERAASSSCDNTRRCRCSRRSALNLDPDALDRESPTIARVSPMPADPRDSSNARAPQRDSHHRHPGGTCSCCGGGCPVSPNLAVSTPLTCGGPDRVRRHWPACLTECRSLAPSWSPGRPG
jgi:hypothetical protein